MSVLMIDLQEGFSGEDVVITLDGNEIFHGESISTRNQTGLAKQVQQEVPSGNHSISVKLGSSTSAQEFKIDVDATPFLGISVSKNDIVFTPKAQAFGYV